MSQLHTSAQGYVFDASSLINLEQQKKLWQLSERGRLAVIHDRIAKEVTKDPRSDLAKWISKHPDRITRTFLSPESQLYIELRQQKNPKIHDPEAIALALAWNRKSILVCDDAAALHYANHYHVDNLTVDQFLEEVEPRMILNEQS